MRELGNKQAGDGEGGFSSSSAANTSEHSSALGEDRPRILNSRFGTL